MTDRATLEWAQEYRSLLDGFTAALGGEQGIAPTKLAMAKTLATLSTELSLMAGKFAANGKGAAAEELSLYLKLSATVADLLKGVGLDRPVIRRDPQGQSVTDKLEAIFAGQIRARQALQALRREEEAAGVFRDLDGRIVTPERLALDLAVSAPSPSPSPPAVAKPSPSVAPRAAPKPKAIPAPVEPSSTELFYQWEAAGGGGNGADMSPPSTWPRLK